jgi:hypothetical protein
MNRRNFLGTLSTLGTTAAAGAVLLSAFPPVSEAQAGERSQWFDSNGKLMLYLKSVLPVPLETINITKLTSAAYRIDQIKAAMPDGSKVYVAYWNRNLNIGASVGENINEVIAAVRSGGAAKRK